MRKANTFFYLKIRNPTSNANGLQDVGCGSVYDLELTTQDEIDKLNYFTLSKEGIIFYDYYVITIIIIIIFIYKV